MYKGVSNIFLVLQFISICSLIIFLGGFFPHESSSREESPVKYSINSNVTSLKLVLMLIDSLRVDFLNSSTRHAMPFLQQSLLGNKTCLLVTKAAAPTVTMPRIKAITSGYVPSYIDIVLNFNSKEFEEDTFLRQATNAGLRAVFYGDDTWLKMFPRTFTRSEGVHSFFAADFWEVDRNVTEGLDKELKRSDWDILVLHYLGLDHIGHMEGPNSPNILDKLKEMDDVIKKISDFLKAKGERTLFLVTGDHGMKNSGGHGGVTNAEIEVPLVSVGKPCNNLPGWPHPWEYIPPQIDIASTIAVALNIPIPSGSVGKIMPHLLNEMSQNDMLNILKSQRRHLLERCSNAPFYEDAVTDVRPTNLKSLANKYFHGLSELSEEIIKQQSDFHLTSLAMSTVFLWIILTAVSGILVLHVSMPSSALHVILIVGTACHTFSLLSTSFIEEEHQTWYFIWATFLLICLRSQFLHNFTVQNCGLSNKIYSILLLCTMHRIFRKLNQTGDKWANVPDLDDYLTAYPMALWIVFLSSLLWTFYLLTTELASRRGRLLFLVVLLSILSYRLKTRIVQVPVMDFYPQSKGSFEVTVFFIATLLFGIVSIQDGANFYWTWVLLSLLTHRPHNAVLVPGLIVVSRNLHSILSKQDMEIWNSLSHAWVGCVFYFYQGNSNSLANIDVAAGFIGMEEYDVAYAGCLIALNTFSAPILSFMLSKQSYPPLIFIKLLPLTLYCTSLIFQRHHLFVWSVFSPKLLLDTAIYLILFLLFICHYSYTVLSGVEKNLLKTSK